MKRMVLGLAIVISGCAIQDRLWIVKSAQTDEQSFVVACDEWSDCERRAATLCPPGFQDTDRKVSIEELRQLGILPTEPQDKEWRPALVRTIECFKPANLSE